MTDVTRKMGDPLPLTLTFRYKDMGDGTWALTAAAPLIVGTSLVGNANPVPVSDANGSLSVDDGGGVLTVDGTVYANLVSPLDNVVTAIKTITVPHHEAHDENMFIASYCTPDGSPIADNAALVYRIVTGNMKPHLTFSVAGGGDHEVELWEDVSVSGAGDAEPEFNMARYSILLPATSVFRGSTFTGGTRIFHAFSPGGTKQQATGGVVREGTEWPLATNQVYILRGINRAGSAKAMSIAVQWYEE